MSIWAEQRSTPWDWSWSSRDIEGQGQCSQCSQCMGSQQKFKPLVQAEPLFEHWCDYKATSFLVWSRQIKVKCIIQTYSEESNLLRGRSMQITTWKNILKIKKSYRSLLFWAWSVIFVFCITFYCCPLEWFLKNYLIEIELLFSFLLFLASVFFLNVYDLNLYCPDSSNC